MWTETLSPIRNTDAADERARQLDPRGLNGLRAALMSFDPPASAGQARMELHFFTAHHIDAVLDLIAGDVHPWDIFDITGGHRLRAGPGAGQVKVLSAARLAGQNAIELVIDPVGDYSTYRLEVMADPAMIDPFFAEIEFKFRPGCFTNECSPEWSPGAARTPAPVIDYMAKDYDSFRHVLINAMQERVPGWQVTSEADFDQVLIDLFAAAADELSDFQDRVMSEAYLGSARGRVSLARHARLMGYHMHQGQQASTWARLTVAGDAAPFTLDEELIAWTGGENAEGAPQAFASRETTRRAAQRTTFHPGFNRFELHTWSGAHPALPAGATGADITPGPAITAADLADAIRDGALSRILIAEELNPRTGRRAGFDRRARQMLRLLPEAEVIDDPLEGVEVVRIRWDTADALRRDYAFTTQCPEGPVANISSFAGNLVELHHGLPITAVFYEPGSALPVDGPTEFHRHFTRQSLYGETRAVIAELPHEAMPLAYLAFTPGGQVAPQSSLRLWVDEPGGAANRWDEVISLVTSDDSAENGDHFMVETDERGQSRLRFGNGVNGRLLPTGARIRAQYQLGGGEPGNVGADAITGFAPLGGALASAIEAITNPFDVTNGIAPEPAAEVIRNAPEAFRTAQARAVTLADYIARAEAVPGVQRAVASYAWTGSWRTVRLVIDPEGMTELDPDLVAAVARHINAVRLIGEDIEIRPPKYVPLTITVRLCLRAHAWPEDVRAEIEQIFSDGWTAWGSRGVFHPDAWTFGQSLHRSVISGALSAVAGVDHVIEVDMQRYDAASPGGGASEVLEMGFDEVLLVQNDPDHMERGAIRFEIMGGRR